MSQETAGKSNGNSFPDGMLLSDFMNWTLPKLREFLADRDIKHTGDKKRLAELAFKAYSLRLEVVKVDDQGHANDIEHNLLSKLTVDGVTLPNPSSLLDGWTHSPVNLPDTTYEEVDRYLADCHAGKAYKGGRSLLDSGHLSNVMTHSISQNIRFCFVRGMCLPEQRQSMSPYDVWVLVHKDTGNVTTGNCSCAAGAAGFCKHVGCLLWHIEKEVRLGNNHASTSKAQKWSVPSKKQQKMHLPEVITKIDIKKPKVGRVLTDVTPSKKGRYLFDPRAPQDRQAPHISQSDLDMLAECTDGNCGLVLLKRKRKNESFYSGEVAQEVEIQSTSMPMTIEEIAQKLRNQSDANSLFYEKLTCSKEEQELIQQLTSEQQRSEVWYAQRKDRITASCFKSAVVKGKSLSNDLSSDRSASFIKVVCGYNKSLTTKAMRWGSKNEDLARKSYLSIVKRTHKKLKISKCGLFISIDYPFLGASPDALLECECHATGLLEIKCPWKYRGLCIKEYAVQPDSCLEIVSGCVQLKRGHQYWYQIQCQMGVTKRSWCDFYLTTSIDFHLEKILFDEKNWPHFVQQAKLSFNKLILPEILSRSLKHNLDDKSYIEDLVNSLVDKVVT